jgi:hypothetical protein
MVLQLRRKSGAERISALLFCLQLLGGGMSPASSSSGPVLTVGAGVAHADQVSVMPPCNEPTHIRDRVRRPLRVPAFTMVFCGKGIAGAAGRVG